MKSEIYDYKESLERYKRIIRGLRNGELALRFLDHLGALGLSIARVSKYAGHLPALLRVIDFDPSRATKEDIERVVAWINSQPYREWTKHDKKLTLRKLIQYAKYGLAATKTVKTVLFVCVENSFRSQIAEAYFNRYAPKGWRAMSAGLKPAEKIHPNAIRLMLEERIDIKSKKPRQITRELQENADIAVIVCSGSQCPIVYTPQIEEWNMPDPVQMPLEEARKIRDNIKGKVLDLINRLERRKPSRI